MAKQVVGGDIIVRLVGRDLTGAAAQTARRNLINLQKDFAKSQQGLFRGIASGVGGRLGAFGGAGIAGGLAGAAGFAGAAIAIKGITAAYERLAPIAARVGENLRRDLLGIPQWARTARMSLDDLAASYAKVAAENQKNLASARGQFTKTFGRELPPGNVRDMQGFQNEQELKAFQANRQALEKSRMDAVKRSQFLQFGKNPSGLSGQSAYVERRLNEMKLAGESTLFAKPELIAEYKKQLDKANKDVRDIEQKMTALDSQVENLHRRRQQNEQRGASIGRGLRGGAGIFNRAIGGGVEGLQSGIRGGAGIVGGFFDRAQQQLAWRDQLAGPADKLREQWNNLRRQKQQGVFDGAPQLFEQARQHLIQQGQGGLAQPRRMGDTPGLQASISRLSTRGPEQRQVEGLSKIERGQKEQTDRLERAMREVLAEIRGEGQQET